MGRRERTKRRGGEGGGNQTPLGRMNVYLGGNLRNVLGLGDGAGGGEGGGGEGGRKLMNWRMNWSYGMAGWIGNEVISPA